MRLTIKSIYEKLYGHFGPQHWWPAETPFEVIIGAILAQNTNWQNVEKALRNLKERRLLSSKALHRAKKNKIAVCIKPSGYYNIKTERLKAFLNFFLQHYQGNVTSMVKEPLPVMRDQLLAIKGIGPETADSILLYALGKPIFVVDAYTKRILLRHQLLAENAGYDETQNLFMKSLENSVELFNEYHALLVKLGKECCLKNKPKCDICPLR